MADVFHRKVMMLAVYAGEIMMKNGAEIYRVEDTITHICRACRIDNVEVFATPTGIFLTFDKGGINDEAYTYIKRIKGVSTDLRKISDVNSFSRRFSTTDLTVDEGMEILKKIDRQTSYPVWAQLAAAVMISSTFALMFGGTMADFAVAAASGTGCHLFTLLLNRMKVNPFVTGFICSAVIAFIAIFASPFVPGSDYNFIIIGSIMLLVPGVSLTNSIRDFLSGDMLAGIARLVEASLTALALAVGAGMIIKLYSILGGPVL